TPIDLSLVQRFSEKRGIPFIADMTFCPPCTTQAFDYNAYAIIHSLSKYLSGHNDVLGGAIITKDEKLHQRLHLLQKTIGAVLSPDECYRTIQGIKTLHLRWKRVSENAEQVASYLSQHPKVKKVWYPSLHKEHESFLSQQFKKGYGGVVSFELLERLSHPVSSFVAGVQESKVITYAESLASPETLLAYPYTMSHGSLSAEEKQALGITEHFFRLSVGFEGAEDIISSLKNGLRFV
ncbi:PLP-dependent transferase, partial [Candidatus Pacearchaeota archaeon]|nr:PLP-dependent transferase [Candidatus Pacearchaeota archaeon]